MLMWLLPYCCMALSCAAAGSDVRAKTVFDYVEPRVRYANIAVSFEVLRPADVERWGQLLNVSDAQLQLMQSQYAGFVEQHNALLDREALRLLHASVDIHLAREAEGGYTSAHSDRMTALLRQGARLRRQLEQVEQAYIDSIEPFLTEEQVLRVPVLRNEAVRRQCRFGGHTMPWAHVDVRSLWERVDQTWLSPDDQELVYEILWEHDLANTPIIRSMTDTYWSSRIEIARHLPAWQSGAMPHDEYVRRYERSQEPFLRSIIRLSTLNENAAMQIVESMPEQVANDFLLVAKSTAFPQLYPDWDALHEAFSIIIADVELEREVVVDVEALSEAYADEYRRLAERLEKFYFDFAKEGVLGRFGFFTQDLPEALEPMLQQRRELSQQWMQRLAETVGDEVLQRHGLKTSEQNKEPTA